MPEDRQARCARHGPTVSFAFCCHWRKWRTTTNLLRAFWGKWHNNCVILTLVWCCIEQKSGIFVGQFDHLLATPRHFTTLLLTSTEVLWKGTQLSEGKSIKSNFQPYWQKQLTKLTPEQRQTWGQNGGFDQSEMGLCGQNVTDQGKTHCEEWLVGFGPIARLR